MADEPFGVVPTGFHRKQFDRILHELRLTAQTVFGPTIITDHESPMGQLIGLFALLSSQLWETAEDTYQSYDPDQAEGRRLEQLGRIRLVRRAEAESDALFRQAITNFGRGRFDIQDLHRALLNIEGVTYVQVFLNEGDVEDQYGLAPGSLGVAVLGGSDQDIGVVMRRYVVPGIRTFGNLAVQTIVDGYCRSFFIVRPALVRVKLKIFFRTRYDNLGCPPPAPSSLREGLIDDLTARMRNGDDVSLYRVRQMIESRYPDTVEIGGIVASRDGPDADEISSEQSLHIGFAEIATFDLADVTIVEAN